MMKPSEKTALVIGCNGTFGSAIGHELVQRGWQVKALIRDIKKKPTWLNANQVVIGSCESLADVESAAKDVGLIVYAANPIYSDWHSKAERMLEPSALVAERLGLHILFPGNVYGFNPLRTPIIDEETATDAVTDKGEIRNRMELRLKEACDNGATVTLVRAGDFIAKDADSSWINYLMSKRKNTWSLANPSPVGHQHSYAWMPDLAANAVALVERDVSGFNVWHEQGTIASHQDWLDALVTLNLKVKVKTFPWWTLKLIAVFNPIMKEVLKMRYLWQQNLLLDGSKMQIALGKDYRLSSLTDIARVLTAE